MMTKGQYNEGCHYSLNLKLKLQQNFPEEKFGSILFKNTVLVPALIGTFKTSIPVISSGDVEGSRSQNLAKRAQK
jgi:hypothetical protein